MAGYGILCLEPINNTLAQISLFMIKATEQYAATGGWGFTRWLGMEQQPYGQDASLVKECLDCHTPVKDNDYVFTRPIQLFNTLQLIDIKRYLIIC